MCKPPIVAGERLGKSGQGGKILIIDSIIGYNANMQTSCLITYHCNINRNLFNHSDVVLNLLMSSSSVVLQFLCRNDLSPYNHVA